MEKEDEVCRTCIHYGYKICSIDGIETTDEETCTVWKEIDMETKVVNKNW